MAVVKTTNNLAEHWLSIARDKNTASEQFRNALENLGLILFLEAVSNLKGISQKRQIKTPLKKTQASFIDQKNIYIVPILRAGLGMLAGIKNLVPQSKVAHVGLYRNEKTLQPHWYLDKLPKKISKDSTFIILEPMLATGGTINTVLERMANIGANKICVISALISEKTRKQLNRRFPHINFYVADIDPELNTKGYIVPGLGDAGDRYFNM